MFTAIILFIATLVLIGLLLSFVVFNSSKKSEKTDQTVQGDGEHGEEGAGAEETTPT
jgi:hypothetical protein